jgi:hypothetical protein
MTADLTSQYSDGKHRDRNQLHGLASGGLKAEDISADRIRRSGQERFMTMDLTTTNVLLGILATVSVLEVLAVVGLLAAGFIMFRRLMKVIEEIEQRRVAPAAARLNDILDDVKAMTDVARRAAESAERAAGWLNIFRRA